MKEDRSQTDISRGEKNVAYSRVEQVHIVMPMDVNAGFSLFGGQLMQWIDVVAAVVARRHAERQVTTAAVDHLEFLAPAHLNDIVVLRGHMTYAGRTSMEVCVDTYVEQVDHGGVRELVNRAYLTLVALDNEKKPTLVPCLRPETEEEKAEFEAAKRRRAERKHARG